MKRLILIVFITTILFALCACSNQNATLTGTVESVGEDSLMIQAINTPEFENYKNVIIRIDEETQIKNIQKATDSHKDFKPGDVVKVTYNGLIMQSLPPKVDAIKIVQQREAGTLKSGSSPRTYREITPEDAKYMMDTEKDVVILDVRTKEESDTGHIKNSILIPDTEIASEVESKVPDKSKRILVYCRSGNRSKIASEVLIKMGYQNVYEFGGITDWPYETVK
ncbi:MAG: Rhodanese domain protein [Oscillospiraceae bacterium]|jgi:rhodanese-related sulfurtransferase|nr:Rhodanese domain protein [Oscillospiraceae bacterium]